MKKKFTMLLASLFLYMGAWAQVTTIGTIGENITDLSSLTEGSYVIFKNVGRNGYVYEQASDQLMKLGNGATVGAGTEYIWHVHLEADGKYSFSSITGNYISTPLDGGDVYTVAVDNEAKDEFTITAHTENAANWKVQSSNNSNIYWDGQGSDGNNRFVGWQGSGTNSQYQIVPITIVTAYSLQVLYQRDGVTVHSEEALVTADAAFTVTAPIFTTIESCTADKGDVVDNGDGTYSCTISEHETIITVAISETSLDLTQTYRLKNVKSGLYMTIVTEGAAEGVQLKALDEENEGQTFSFAETMTKNGYTLTSESSYYLTASGYWNYSATETSAAGSTHIIEKVSDGVYRLRSVNGYIGSNQDATAAGSPMYSNHPSSRNTIDWEFVSTVVSADAMLREEMAELKSEAQTALAGLSVSVTTVPLTAVKDALSQAIETAETNAESTDLDVLNSAIAGLRDAIALNKNILFNNGALASLEAGEYVIYYEDANSVKHYLVNNKTTKRAVTSTIASVYDVTLGNVNGYAAYAYYFDMNQSKISNPTNNDAKEIQVEPKGSGNKNYESNRVWDSQVLYVNAAGKYAIRSTNCNVGEGWKSDCFITVSEDGATVSGQDTDLNDALYKWNVVKASEANIAYAMNIDEYKYMTLYLNYAVEVPAGVTAYAVSGAENGELTLASVGNVIPENTPVIVEGNANAYSFIYADPVGAYAGTNLLKGTWLDSYVTPTTGYDAYVMALNGTEVVMGKATLNEGVFKNRANKAYLELPTVQDAPAMFSFGRGEGTTSIDNVQLTNDNVVIYDLTGRRVEKMEKGIYIVNGKKVIR